MLVTKMRVVLSRDVNLMPYTTLLRGELGTVVYVETSEHWVPSVDVMLDKHHKGLVEWDNVAHLAGPELEALTPLPASLFCLNAKRMGTVAAKAFAALWGACAVLLCLKDVL